MRIKHILTGQTQMMAARFPYFDGTLSVNAYSDALENYSCVPKEKSTTFHVSMTISLEQKDLR